MDKITLNGSLREVIGKKVKNERLEGKLPGVIYGKGLDKPIPINLDLREATKILREVSSSTLLTLDVDGSEYNALVRERQRDVIRGDFIHIDFMSIALDEKVKAFVNVFVEGESLAVKELSALLITGVDRVEVESLPQDLPEGFTVDVTALEKFGDGILVKDLVIPDGVDLLTDPEEMVVVATAPTLVEEEEEEELLDEELEEGVEPEVIEKGKREEEEEEEE